LTVFKVAAGRFITTMDLVMAEKEILSPETDIAHVTYVVDMPRVVFAMPI
jgi:hypothetical protein